MAQQGAEVGQPQQGQQEVGASQDHGDLVDGQVGEEDEGEQQGSHQRADIVHAQDLGKVGLETGRILAVDADQQGDFETDEDADPQGESPQQQHVAGGIDVGQVDGQGADPPRQPQQDLHQQELVHQVAADVLLQGGSQAHGEHHQPDDHEDLLVGRAHQVVAQRPQGVLVGNPAGPHDEHGRRQHLPGMSESVHGEIRV